MTEKPLKYQAYALIRQKIINCEYAPGAFITENLLQETVPGSRTPVRDAIGRLEQENLVTIFPKKGILVAPVLPKDISSLFQLRMMWEPYAVQKYGNMLSCDFYMSFYDHFSPQICATTVSITKKTMNFTLLLFRQRTIPISSGCMNRSMFIFTGPASG